MTMHLSSQECVTALDNELTPARREHLDACESCQEQVTELRALVNEAAHDADVPEPSPLFWDHFQTRVLTAVQREEPSRRTWWTTWLDTRTFVAIGVLAVVAASVALYMNRPIAPVADSLADATAVESSAVAETTTSLDGDEWEFVASVMGTLEGDDIHEVLAPSPNAVDAAMESLTGDERDRLVKLLKAEMGEGLE